ncbi:hypothetical protein JW930_06820 [Candidatus Woesearchaeota archaeon]|nr:hypothetical protein [Candidatus Woesearchaeota archaeon]
MSLMQILGQIPCLELSGEAPSGKCHAIHLNLDDLSRQLSIDIGTIPQNFQGTTRDFVAYLPDDLLSLYRAMRYLDRHRTEMGYHVNNYFFCLYGGQDEINSFGQSGSATTIHWRRLGDSDPGPILFLDYLSGIGLPHWLFREDHSWFIKEQGWDMSRTRWQIGAPWADPWDHYNGIRDWVINQYIYNERLSIDSIGEILSDILGVQLSYDQITNLVRERCDQVINWPGFAESVIAYSREHIGELRQIRPEINPGFTRTAISAYLRAHEEQQESQDLADIYAQRTRSKTLGLVAQENPNEFAVGDIRYLKGKDVTREELYELAEALNEHSSKPGFFDRHFGAPGQEFQDALRCLVDYCNLNYSVQIVSDTVALMRAYCEATKGQDRCREIALSSVETLKLMQTHHLQLDDVLADIEKECQSYVVSMVNCQQTMDFGLRPFTPFRITSQRIAAALSRKYCSSPDK